MKRALLALVAVLLAVWSYAAGSAVAVVTTVPGTNVVRYDVTWTSTAGGAVSANPITVQAGYLLQTEFVPGAGGTQPTDLYDATLNDAAGSDLLVTAGANLSNATSKLVIPTVRPYCDGTLDVVIANAGNAKTGVVTIWIGR